MAGRRRVVASPTALLGDGGRPGRRVLLRHHPGVGVRRRRPARRLAMQSGSCLRRRRAVTQPSGSPCACPGWAGLAAIVGARVLYTERTPFPGYAALLPGRRRAGGDRAPARARAVVARAASCGLRPTQLLGDISYSLYLWHWPLIVLVPAALGWCDSASSGSAGRQVRRPRPVARARLADDDAGREPVPARARRSAAAPARRGGRSPSSPRHRALGAVAVAGGAWFHVRPPGRDARQRRRPGLRRRRRPCFGAAAMTTPGCDRTPLGDGVVTPDPAGALADLRNSPARRRCFRPARGRGPQEVHLRARQSADMHVVLFGDSHALQWFGALDGDRPPRGLAAHDGPARVLHAELRVHDAQRRRSRPAAATPGPREAIAAIAADPTVDVVVTSAFNNKKWRRARAAASTPTAPASEAYRRTLGAVHDATAGRSSSCATPRARWARTLRLRRRGHRAATAAAGPATPALRAGKLVPRQAGPDGRRRRPSGPAAVHLVDLTDRVLRPKPCPAVIGNVLVYADSNHMTPTFSRTLATPLRERLRVASARCAAPAGRHRLRLPRRPAGSTRHQPSAAPSAPRGRPHRGDLCGSGDADRGGVLLDARADDGGDRALADADDLHPRVSQRSRDRVGG